MPYLTLGNKVGSNQEIVESFPERHIGAVCAKRYPLKQSRDSRKSSALPPIVEELRSGSNQEIVERLSREAPATCFAHNIFLLSLDCFLEINIYEPGAYNVTLLSTIS